MIKLFYKCSRSGVLIDVVLLLETMYISTAVYKDFKSSVYQDKRYTQPKDLIADGFTELHVT